MTPEIVNQPESITVPAKQTATFSVEATGSGLTYQWQYSYDKGVTWGNLNTSTIPSAATDTLTFTASKGSSGCQYRCVVTNTAGVSVVSNAATMRVTAEVIVTPEIVNQPESITVPAKQTATFSVEATGSNLTYQWQYSYDKGVTWGNLNTSTIPSAATDTLTFTASKGSSGCQYRCVVTNTAGVSVVSNAATMVVC